RSLEHEADLVLVAVLVARHGDDELPALTTEARHLCVCLAADEGDAVDHQPPVLPSSHASLLSRRALRQCASAGVSSSSSSSSNGDTTSSSRNGPPSSSLIIS